LLDINVTRFSILLEGVVVTSFQTFTIPALMTDNDLFSAIQIIQNPYPRLKNAETPTLYCRAGEFAQLTSCASFFGDFQFQASFDKFRGGSASDIIG